LSANWQGLFSFCGMNFIGLTCTNHLSFISMKKLFTLALLGLTAGTTYAQTPLTKGRGLLSGSIGYRSEKVSGQRNIDLFNLTPTIGYFIADNLALGINGDLQIQGGNSYYFGQTVYSVGPFARYYHFVGGSDKFALYGQGSLGYRHYSLNVDGNSQGYVGITPGLAFFPIPRFGLEASLRGLSYATNFDNSHSLDFGFSLQNIQLGAAYYFGK
jgi:hypothetical protein